MPLASRRPAATRKKWLRSRSSVSDGRPSQRLQTRDCAQVASDRDSGGPRERWLARSFYRALLDHPPARLQFCTRLSTRRRAVTLLRWRQNVNTANASTTIVLGRNDVTTRLVFRGLGRAYRARRARCRAESHLGAAQCRRGSLISNNDWQDNAGQAAELTASGLAPTDEREAGLAVAFAGHSEVTPRPNYRASSVPPHLCLTRRSAGR